MVRSALVAAAVAVGATVLKSEWPIQCLSRFDVEDQVPVSASSTAAVADDLGVSVQEVAPFLLVISPKDKQQSAPDAEWLAAWLEKHTAWFRDTFFERGALIFRGFRVPDARAFEKVALAVNPELETAYLGTSPRSQINGTTYVHTAADFNPHRTVPVHLEMSFRDDPPRLQIFYASRLDQSRGGETPLTDFHGVWNTLSEKQSFMRRFEDKRVKYIRNNDDCGSLSTFDPLVQKCWQEMFKTDNRTQVLAKCAEESFECTWDEANRLRMTNLQPFVRTHPKSGKKVWFNHINVLHKDSMAYDYERTASLWGGFQGWWPLVLSLYYRGLYAALSLVMDESDLGSALGFEDGGLISAQDFREIKRATWRNTVQQPYQLHDIVVVDNMRVGHGREIYVGAKETRRVMTAWSNPYPAKWSASDP